MRKYTALVLICMTASAASGFAMGRIPKKAYEAKVAELGQCNASLADAHSKVSSLEANNSKLDTDKAQLETNNAQLLKDMDSSKSDLQQRVADMTRDKQEIEKTKQAEVDKLKSTYEDLVKDMRGEIEQGSIQITQLQNKLSVNLVDKILFNSGEAAVNAAGKMVLERVANVLKKVQNKQIRIEGHTDNVPIGGALKEKFPSNWELSTARATTVARFLTEACEINPSFVSAAGYAHFRPIADNATNEGKSKNRRIEIALVPLEVSAATPAAPVKKDEIKKP